ncbi:MAG: alpha-mannosidase [Verrucomicrobiae bacterium]|nr:alpha-mannosidase [Verrucomicrobiae bacterium]
MLTHPEITAKRIDLAIEEIRTRFYPHRTPVSLAVFKSKTRIPYAEAVLQPFTPSGPGENLGALWDTSWFHVQAVVPPAGEGREIHFLWNTGAEGLVWIDGQPRQGFSIEAHTFRNGTSLASPLKDPRTDFRLCMQAQAGQKFDFFVECAANALFGVLDEHMQPKRAEFAVAQAEIAVFDREAWDLYWDAAILSQTLQSLPAESPRRGQLLFGLNAFVNALVLEDRATWPAARALLQPLLSARNAESQHGLSAVGHAHIDTAWLWPLDETKRKCARTFATALEYMEEYPEYKFVCSQAQQYAWMKELYPQLYTRIKQAVAAGRFIPVGGTWIEPDCNIPSGESLVRQFLYGQRFFREEFGIECREFWNPDVFGYSAALPQIVAGFGMRYFLTQKLSWNQFNRPTHHTFLWEGLDGTQLFTHFPPADTYNADFTPWQLQDNVRKFKDHDRANESLYLFGYGDGGGGPTKQMLEIAKRAKDLEGLPKVEIRAPRDFWARAEAEARDLPVWIGELYFELHRGTYTSQAANKKSNRRCENLLREIECIAAVASLHSEEPYPAEELRTLWQLLLLNQFHDIIPGSSITEVYEDSTRDYARIEVEAARLLARFIDEPSAKTSAQNARLRVMNSLVHPRREVVELSDKSLCVVSAPSCGFRAQNAETEIAEKVTFRSDASGFTLENDHLRAVLSKTGILTSLLHKASGRETIHSHQDGQLAVYEDKPLFWDAWDVDVFHLEKRSPVGPASEAQLLEMHPLRCAVRFEYTYGSSTITQVVSLTALSQALEFDCKVHWQEKSKFLKAEFDVDVRAPEATYEIQFGHVKRPTHYNTSWDIARFEVCGHRWADFSEHGFGVALLNDCKYGYGIHGRRMGLSLLRAPNAPDPKADRGHHCFRYALMPHAGDWQAAGVLRAAQNFNSPLRVLPALGPDEIDHTFFAVDNPGVVLETIKRAEDSPAMILRLYEAFGGTQTVTVTTPLPFKSARLCNLNEEPGESVPFDGGRLTLTLKPFKIASVMLEK